MYDSDECEYIESADLAGYEELTDRLCLCLDIIKYLISEFEHKLDGEDVELYVRTINWFMDRNDTIRVLDELLELRDYLDSET